MTSFVHCRNNAFEYECTNGILLTVSLLLRIGGLTVGINVIFSTLFEYYFKNVKDAITHCAF